MKLIAIQRLGKLYLTLASYHSKDCDYDKAIKWYQKALEISKTEHSHHVLYEKALTGLGIAMFHTGDNEKAIESIQKAQSFSGKEIEIGKYDRSVINFIFLIVNFIRILINLLKRLKRW